MQCSREVRECQAPKLGGLLDGGTLTPQVNNCKYENPNQKSEKCNSERDNETEKKQE
jgi:hypothetical protein